MEEIKKTVFDSYRDISFIERYEYLINEYSSYFDNRMSKLDNKEVKRIFTERGYKAKMFSPGQYFYFEETFQNKKFVFEVDKRKGIFICKIDIYYDFIKVTEYTPFHFVYKLLVDDMNLDVPVLCYSNVIDFEDLLIKSLHIYEDFRDEFLKNMEGVDL